MNVSIQLTDAAVEKAKALLSSSDTPGAALRVRVVDGGCSGMRYELLFDAEERDDDGRLDFGGLPVLLDAESARFLEGTTIDFVDSLNESGFKIDNPNAEESCGCGESFRV